MSHITSNHRLEKMQTGFPMRLQIVIAPLLTVWAWLMTPYHMHVAPSLTMYRRRVRAAWRLLQGRAAYEGAPVLPDEESIPWQWRMAKALGGSDRALIVTKFHQWIGHNKKEGGPAATRNGYEEWVTTHFGHLTPSAFGGHIRALEEMGVLKTQRVGKASPQGAYDQRKSYRIDYGRLNALIAAVKKAVSSLDTGESKTQTRKSKTNGAYSNLNNDSKSPNQSLKPNSETQPSKPGRGGRRAGAGRKAKTKEALIETSAPDQQASGEAEIVSQSTDTGDSDFAGPSPHSEAPSSRAEAELTGRMTALSLDEGKAAALITQHGENRVRAVVHKCELRLRPDSREQKIDRPAGWIIRELENDVFKLGTMTAGDEQGLHRDANPHAGLMGAYKTYDPTQDLQYRRATDDAAVEVFERLFGDKVDSPPVEIEAWRLEALRRENERWAAEEAEAAVGQPAEDCEAHV